MAADPGCLARTAIRGVVCAPEVGQSATQRQEDASVAAKRVGEEHTA